MHFYENPYLNNEIYSRISDPAVNKDKAAQKKQKKSEGHHLSDEGYCLIKGGWDRDKEKVFPTQIWEIKIYLRTTTSII